MGLPGSGKTTLLNLISGLDSFEDGTIKVFDENLCKLSIEEKILYQLIKKKLLN